MKLPANLAAALAAALLLDTAVAATSGKFSVLSINVAGLPRALNDDKVPGYKDHNAATIGAKLSEHRYDVVHIQEDFSYHEDLYSTNRHPFRTPTSGIVPYGSGLNTVSYFPWHDFQRVWWRNCFYNSSPDCRALSGFTLMRVALDITNGGSAGSTAVYVDFYNLHADAGVAEGDFAARQENINQLMAYIEQWSRGNAVVVLGGFNSRYAWPADTATRQLLAASGAGLTDAWVELRHRGAVPGSAGTCPNPAAANAVCEEVDKVMYRSSPLVTLRAEAFRYEGARFLQANGSVLTDHNPVFAQLAWTAGASLRQSDFFGGPHGTWFSDVPLLARKERPKVSTLAFRGAARLDSVSVTLTSGLWLRHGGSGGTEVSLRLGPSEYWVEAELCRGERKGKMRNFYIRARTTSNRSITAGTRTADCRTFTAPSGWQIVGFAGRDGDEMDQLAFVYGPR